jgi:hypothetical protein
MSKFGKLSKIMKSEDGFILRLMKLGGFGMHAG